MANIMVVDDDHLIRHLLKQVLKLNKHNVVEAANGMEALRKLNPLSPPELILMDHQMPKLSGIECARSIKALYPSLKIVLVSGSFGIDDDGYLVANKHLFSDILLKPFQIKDIVRTVEYCLGADLPENLFDPKLPYALR